MGHDFHKDKGGEFVKPWPMGWKSMCLLTLFLSQPLSLRMVAGGWGSYGLWEWGGRTVSPHPHTHSTMEKTLTHFHFHVLFVGCSFSCARLPGFTHADLSSADLWMGGCILSSQADFGCCGLPSLWLLRSSLWLRSGARFHPCTDWEYVFLLPSVASGSFSTSLVVQGGLSISPRCECVCCYI